MTCMFKPPGRDAEGREGINLQRVLAIRIRRYEQNRILLSRLSPEKMNVQLFMD